MEDRLNQQGVLNVKIALVSTVFVASLIVVLGLLVSDTQTQAQQPRPAPAQPGTSVAVIDIGYIFKNDEFFKKKMETLKKDVQAVDQQLGKEYQVIQQLERKLRGFKRDSPQFGPIEAEIARRKVELKTKTRNQRRQFIERETQIRYDEYRRIRDQVKFFAERYGISLVLRVSSDQAGQTKNAREKLQTITRSVVYRNQQRIDITGPILDALKLRISQGPGPSRRPTVPYK